MPSKSKAQQRFMGLVHAFNKGDVPASKVSKKVKDVAKDMKKKDVKDFASTKHKGKPEKVKQEAINKIKEMIRLELESCGYTMSAENPNYKLKSPGGTGDEDKKLKAIGEYINENPQKVIKLLIKRGNKPNRVKDMVKKHYKKAKKDRSKARPSDLASYISFLDANESVNEAGLEMNKLKDAIKMFQKKIKKQGRVTNARDEEHLKNLIKVYKQMGGKGVKEAVIKVSKKDDIPGNPMKMKGEEKIKKLVYSGSINNKGSYEIKGNKLNVNNIRPRDKGFFVRHFTMGTGFRKANLYYDGVHWQGGKKF